MSFLSSFDVFLTEHLRILIAWIFMTLAIIIGLNVVSFVNAYKGTRHPFPMVLSLANILTCIFFIPYIVIYFKKDKFARIWFYFGISSVCLTHWILAHRYY